MDDAVKLRYMKKNIAINGNYRGCYKKLRQKHLGALKELLKLKLHYESREN